MRMYEAGELEVDHSGVPREGRRGDVTMLVKIGEGQFGEVWKGILDESSSGGVPGYTVAIKTLKTDDVEGSEEMFRESAVMAQLGGNGNVTSLVGVVTAGFPKLMLLSYCEYGSLLTFLKSHTDVT